MNDKTGRNCNCPEDSIAVRSEDASYSSAEGITARVALYSNHQGAQIKTLLYKLINLSTTGYRLQFCILIGQFID